MSFCIYCKAPVSAGVPFCCHSCELLSNWKVHGKTPLKPSRFVSEKWEKYNLSEIEDQFNFSNCPIYKEFRFYIDGLQCSSCVHLLEDFPQYCGEVVESRLNYAKRTLEIKGKPLLLLGEICEAIEELGYSPTPLKGGFDYEKARVFEKREDLKRIGVAGAVAGNCMLFSVPIYFGLEGTLASIFEWISFLLFIPLLCYSAAPFYRRAWISLLVRRVNVDMMIIVALWAGFAFSTYSLIVGSSELYFDSTASFIFLILLTRYLLKQQQDKLIQKNVFTDLFINEAYEVTESDLSRMVAYSSIKQNQILTLKKNQMLPCDSVLISDKGDFDLSFLTGEAYPQIRHKDDIVLAGSRLLSHRSILKPTSDALESHLAKSLNSLESEYKSRSGIQSLSDLVSHRLTLTVFSIAGVFFLATYHTLGFEAFKRCLALITIACPCAVAFGTPLAHSLGLRKAGQKGFFIRSSTVFEKFRDVKKVIFDKTGTLTSSQLKLIKTFPAVISEEDKSVILGLEKSSMHPLALSLKSIWADSEVECIADVTELVGEGVTANFNSHNYRLVKSSADNEAIVQADYFVDGKPIAYLYFEESVVPEARNLIADINKLDIDVMMLSGDKRIRAIEVAKKLGIRPSFVFSEQSAESKKEIVRAQNPCLFVGDGLNDLPALSQAYISFAVRGTFESTMQVSDIYAPKKNLNSILEIFQLSKRIHNTVKANLLFALFYNSLGGTLALLGFINPLAAAILMPLSSVLITAHTIWRLR